MKVETKLRIESGDLCTANRLEDAFNLIGGRDLSEEEQKPFSRVRGNDFRMEDAEHAVAIIRRRSAQMLEQAETADVFKDPTLQATWADGQRVNAQLAIRKAEDFISALRADLHEAIGTSDSGNHFGEVPARS